MARWEIRIPSLLLRWLARGPATRRYPRVKRPPFPATRGSIAIDAPRCTLCTLCQKRCPTDAIVVSRKEKTWSIDRLHCTACRACVEVCPVKCLSMLPAWTDPPLKKGMDVFQRPDPTPRPAPAAPEAPAEGGATGPASGTSAGAAPGGAPGSPPDA